MTAESPDRAGAPEEERKGADRAPDEKEIPTDVAEKPGSDAVSHDHADALVDEWGEESFPGSDPPAHY